VADSREGGRSQTAIFLPGTHEVDGAGIPPYSGVSANRKTSQEPLWRRHSCLPRRHSCRCANVSRRVSTRQTRVSAPHPRNHG
jgi:hypothetical protein